MASTSTSTSTAAVAAGGEGWAAVSSDVRVLVLSWLDLPSALALALTCKAMAEDFSSYNFWERRYKDMSRAEPFVPQWRVLDNVAHARSECKAMHLMARALSANALRVCDLALERVALRGQSLIARKAFPKTQCASVQAHLPLLPLPVGDFSIGYYEIHVTAAAGPSASAGYACVGVALRRYERRMPGWYSDSYGYHGDDGSKWDDGIMYRDPAFVPFRSGDTLGCGIHFPSHTIFFTRNGTLLGEIVAAEESFLLALVPTIGLVECAEGDRVDVHLGLASFVYDLRQHQLDKRAHAALAPPSSSSSSSAEGVAEAMAEAVPTVPWRAYSEILAQERVAYQTRLGQFDVVNYQNHKLSDKYRVIALPTSRLDHRNKIFAYREAAFKRLNWLERPQIKTLLTAPEQPSPTDEANSARYHDALATLQRLAQTYEVQLPKRPDGSLNVPVLYQNTSTQVVTQLFVETSNYVVNRRTARNAASPSELALAEIDKRLADDIEIRINLYVLVLALLVTPNPLYEEEVLKMAPQFTSVPRPQPPVTAADELRTNSEHFLRNIHQRLNTVSLEEAQAEWTEKLALEDLFFYPKSTAATVPVKSKREVTKAIVEECNQLLEKQIYTFYPFDRFDELSRSSKTSILLSRSLKADSPSLFPFYVEYLTFYDALFAPQCSINLEDLKDYSRLRAFCGAASQFLRRDVPRMRNSLRYAYLEMLLKGIERGLFTLDDITACAPPIHADRETVPEFITFLRKFDGLHNDRANTEPSAAIEAAQSFYAHAFIVLRDALLFAPRIGDPDAIVLHEHEDTEKEKGKEQARASSETKSSQPPRRVLPAGAALTFDYVKAEFATMQKPKNPPPVTLEMLFENLSLEDAEFLGVSRYYVPKRPWRSDGSSAPRRTSSTVAWVVAGVAATAALALGIYWMRSRRR